MLPRDRGSQLHHLSFTKVLPQPRCQVDRNIGWRLCHRNRKIQHHALQIVKSRTGLVVRKIEQLIFSYAGFSADGRADIESEWATDQRACLDRCQRLKPGIDAPTGKQCHLEYVDSHQQRRTVPQQFHGLQRTLLAAHNPHQCHRSSQNTHIFSPQISPRCSSIKIDGLNRFNNSARRDQRGSARIEMIRSSPCASVCFLQ